ncbi:MAG: 5'/3'-nucleotidase SurE [Candidatus Cloacimonetes bacterium]|nr:5'/3'-nucleotidase SurE [Candidatus Cloacimonadota bacterium]MBS3767045.1 5'/3'-nucleotidase SurE [Candidatus Cloacimonadota bacterium]
MKKILLTNDDGVSADGIRKLAEVLKKTYDVIIVAPDRERSASSQALTLHSPLRLKEIENNVFSVDGTPTDCVNLATNIVDNNGIDLVISGINRGQNMGEDVLYSGTVAAAIEAMNLGYPAIAVSLTDPTSSFLDCAKIIHSILENDIFSIITEKTIFNINIPPLPPNEIKGIKVTKLGHRVYNDFIQERVDPRGKSYFWIGGEAPQWQGDEKTDVYAIQHGYVSITPITIDMSDYNYFPVIKKWLEDKFSN